MKFNFVVYKLKEESKAYSQLINVEKDKNEFIVVGEDKRLNCYKIHPLDNIVIIGGLKLDACAYLVNRDDLYIDCDELSRSICEIDIPKKHLTVTIIDNIKRLND